MSNKFYKYKYFTTQVESIITLLSEAKTREDLQAQEILISRMKRLLLEIEEYERGLNAE